MEEQPDDQYEESEKEEPVEAPAPPQEKVCKPVKTDLKEKVQCACGRWMSQHTYKYQHKCKAKSVDEMRKPAEPEASQARAPEVLPVAEAVPEEPVAVPEPEPVEVPPPPPKLKRAKAAAKEKPVKQEKLPPPAKAVNMKSVIRRQQPVQEEYYAPPPPMNIYQAMLANRAEQARLYNDRLLAPYAEMFSHRR